MSAAVNPTFWLLAGVLLCACVSTGTVRRQLTGLLRTRGATWSLLALLTIAALANVAARALIGHAVPGDFVQEVAAARSFQANGTLYASDINADVQEWLRQDPPFLPGWLPNAVTERLRARQVIGRNVLSAQAHPPTLLLGAAPLIWFFGAYSTYWMLALASVVCGVLASQLLLVAWKPAPSVAERWLAAVALVSWQPTLATIRDGQVSVIIGALLITCWSMVRIGKSRWGGVAAGIAAVLKLYPAPVLLLLALQRQRASTASLCVVAATVLAVTAFAGLPVWSEYSKSAEIISWSFATSPHNLAIVARIAAVSRPEWLGVWYAAAAAAVCLVTFTATRKGRWSDGTVSAVDVDFAIAISMAMLLSPVAWHHYAFMLAQPLAVVLVACVRTEKHRWPLVVWTIGVLLLSVPDDAVREVWARVSTTDVVTRLLSPGVVVLALWSSVVYLRISGLPARCVPREGREVRAARIVPV
jgi:hypothetical protein